MKLAETIISNERQQLAEENQKIVRLRLKELVYAFPKETLEVLHKTGVQIGSILPPGVVYAVVIKHLGTNSELREAIAKMLLEADGYSSADGQGWGLIGGALTALGSVLSGIGRSQTQQSESDSDKQVQLMQQQLDADRAKRTRNTWIIVGIAVVALITAILIVRAIMKSKAAKAAAESTANVAGIVVPKLQKG